MSMYPTAAGCEPFNPDNEEREALCAECGDPLRPDESRFCADCERYSPCHNCDARVPVVDKTAVGPVCCSACYHGQGDED